MCAESQWHELLRFVRVFGDRGSRWLSLGRYADLEIRNRANLFRVVCSFHWYSRLKRTPLRSARKVLHSESRHARAAAEAELATDRAAAPSPSSSIEERRERSHAEAT